MIRAVAEGECGGAPPMIIEGYRWEGVAPPAVAIRRIPVILTVAERDRWQETGRRWEAADERAEKALRRHLTPEQRRTYSRWRWIGVTGSRGGRYRIRTHSVMGNVHAGYKNPSGRWVQTARYCAVPAANLPLADVFLTQLLFLKYQEEHFLSIARRFWDQEDL